MPPLEINFTITKEQYKRLVRYAYWYCIPLKESIALGGLLLLALAQLLMQTFLGRDWILGIWMGYALFLLLLLFSIIYALFLKPQRNWKIARQQERTPRRYCFYDDHVTLRARGNGWEQGLHIYYAVLRNKRERQGDFFFTARSGFPHHLPQMMPIFSTAQALAKGETYYFIPREALTPEQAEQLRALLGIAAKKNAQS